MTKLPARTAKKSTPLVDAPADSLMLQETSLWLQNFISDRTRVTYKKAVQDFAGFAELETADDLYDVDAAAVLAWREHLIANEMSNNSVANRMSALSSLFNHLCDRQVVQVNPVQGIKRPKTATEGVTPAIANKVVRRILDDSAAALTNAKTSNASLLAARDSAILHVLFYLGPRVSEVCSMNVGDIVADGEYTVVKLTVKGGAAHRVPAPPEALNAVKQYLLMSGHTKGPMFQRVKGGDGRLSRIAIYNIFKKAVKRSVVEGDFSTHSARATFATESLDGGSLLEHVQAALGHANITTTQMYDRRKTLHRDSPTLRVRYG